MKKYLLFLSAAILSFAACSKIDNHESEDDGNLKAIITFEDPTLDGGLTYWSTKIDNVQYGGNLIYAAGEYSWEDTYVGLSHTIAKSEYDGVYYWSDGAAISNYVTNKKDASYTEQLSVYTSSVNGGYDESANFAVWYGHDWGAGCSGFTFKYPTTIMGMWVNNTAYGLAYTRSNTIEASQYIEIVINAVKTDGTKASQSFKLVDGPDGIISNWSWWDLSTLGEINSFSFNVTGNINDDYGFAYPAYFAFDDIHVSVRK